VLRHFDGQVVRLGVDAGVGDRQGRQDLRQPTRGKLNVDHGAQDLRHSSSRCHRSAHAALPYDEQTAKSRGVPPRLFADSPDPELGLKAAYRRRFPTDAEFWATPKPLLQVVAELRAAAT
jgi:hypothetical protein